MRRRATLALVLLVWLAACTPDNGFQSQDISRVDYGDRWPLTVDDAVLSCEPGKVPTVTVEGETYGLEPDDREQPPPGSGKERIWADGSAGGTRGKRLLRRDALALCE